MDEFETIFKKYSPVVYRFLLSHCRDPDLAEEMTGETFYRAYLAIGSFRGECRVETWLCRIARNALTKEQRRRGRFPGPDTAPSEPADPSPGPLARALEREQALELHRKLHTLHEPYREVFTLRVFGELAFRDIANIFGKTESWAKVTYYRARDKLIERLEEENGDQL